MKHLFTRHHEMNLLATFGGRIQHHIILRLPLGCTEEHSTFLYIFNVHSLLMLQNPSKQPVVCEEFSLGVKTPRSTMQKGKKRAAH